MTEIRITRIDPADEHDLLAWNEVMRTAYTADRTATWWRSPEATLTQFATPRTGKEDIALIGRLGDEAICGAEVNLTVDSPADVELGVLPDHRRRGCGAALAEAVEQILTDRDRTSAIVQTETYCAAGVAFARSRGMRIGNEEHRLLLDLPAYLDADANRYKDSGASTTVPVVKEDPDFSVTSWIGGCPEDILEDWTRLREQMDEDVPLGDLTRVVSHAGTAAIRSHEERMDEQGWVLVSSMAHVGDLAVGYTEIMVSVDDPQIVIQEDTLVDRTYRGRGIGRALKVANLRQLPAVEATASARWVQTYTATNNGPMLALNRDLGFEVVDTMTALEGRVDSRRIDSRRIDERRVDQR
ncbi:N-acetyltransferase [Brevibacterium spongiae]|uniref:N-acetyltransferase n=1 Tax=Brevibacterium spongiae TaxID=2909672 RepID=A0ABY5SR34_9MICO|nr:N-acetyltransferase [Brevibacterium spongiae]UVI37002.1 N-acetyltransferase [Brevibacterium spongiae]